MHFHSASIIKKPSFSFFFNSILHRSHHDSEREADILPFREGIGDRIYTF